MGHFAGFFEGAKTFLTPKLLRSGQFRGQKGRGPLEKPQEMPHYMFYPDKKIISRTFKIRGSLVFLCPKEEERRERREERGERREERRETKNERRGTRDEGRGTRDEGRGTRDDRRETRDERKETRDERQVSERIQMWAIFFLNRPGQMKNLPIIEKSGIVCIQLSLGAVSYILSR
jgi:hypothetical protein